MEPLAANGVPLLMLDLLLLAAVTASSPDAEVLAECKPALQKKAGGEIQSIAVDAKSETGGWVVIRGPMTTFIGMSAAPPGSASTHHLIRAEYQYVCWVRGGRVRKTTLLQP